MSINMKERIMRLLSKKLVIGATVGVVVLGVTTGVVAAMVSGSPWKRVRDSIEKTVSVVKEQPFVAEINDVLDKGSVEISMNTAELTYGLLSVDVSAKLYSGIKENVFAVVADAAMNGTPFLDASAKMEKQMLTVSSDALLDEIYGIELQESPDLKTNLNEFWKASEKQIVKYLMDSVAVEETEGTMTYFEEETAFDELIFRADADGITEFLYNTAVYLKDSEEFALLADEYAAYYESLYTKTGTEQEFSRDNAVKTVYDTLDKLITQKEEIRKKLQDTKLCVRFLISEEDYLLCVTAEAEQKEERVSCSVSAGPAPDRISKINVQAEIDNRIYGLVYAVENNTEELFAGNLRFSEEDNVVAEVQFDKDRSNGNFSVQFSENGEKENGFYVKGTVVTDENATVIDVEELVLDEAEYDLGLGITIKKEDSIPEMPVCTEVLPPEEESVQIVIEDLTEELGELLSLFL